MGLPCRSQQRLSSIGVAEMTGANSGCLLRSMGHPCIGGCRRSGGHSPSRCVAVLDGSSLLSVALGGSSSIEMCRHSRCYPCGDDRSQQRLSAVPGGSSLHWWVSPFSMGYPCCLLRSMGHPCRCQKSTATVLHRWVSLFSMDHPCCLLRSVGHPCRCQKSIATVFH